VEKLKREKARELMEEAGLSYSEIEPVDVIDNEDGTTSSYFVVNFEDYDGEVQMSPEHCEYKFMGSEELEGLPVIKRQNERFTHLLTKAKELKKEVMAKLEEGAEIIMPDGTVFVIKDGKPEPKEKTAEVAASEEKPKEGEEGADKTKEIAAAVETPEAGGMTEEAVRKLFTELLGAEVKPMIDEAMKAAIDAMAAGDEAKDAVDTEDKKKTAEMAYSEQVKRAQENKGAAATLAAWGTPQS
jgi:hypothetical protein